MPFSKRELLDLYRKRAQRYDFTANLYYVIGYRERSYRRRAIAALGLTHGDTVVEIGCGTGLNFPLLQAAVGPQGHIIGVDLTDRMLEKAQEKVDREGWRNVQLLEMDAAAFEFPPGTNGIISTFALTLIPEFDAIIQRGTAALMPGGSWVVADLKLPDGFAAHFTALFAPLVGPFGATRDLVERHPWESMSKYLVNVKVTEVYFGFTYIASGQAPAANANTSPGTSAGSG